MEIKSTTEYPVILMPWIATGVYNDRLNTIQMKHALMGNKESGFYALARDVMQRTLPLARIPDVARASLFMTQQEAMLLARDIVGWLVLPVAFIFYDSEDVMDYFEEWGGRESDYPLPDNLKEIVDNMSDWFEYEEVENIFAEIEKEKVVSDQAEANESDRPADTHIAEDKIKDVYKNILTPEVEKRIKKLHDLYNKDSDDFTKEFYTAINSRSVDNVVASLWTLAERGKLLYLLSEDKKISSLLAKHLEKKFNHPTADHFSEARDEIGYLAYFLRHLLVDTLKIAEADAAALVVHLLNKQSSTTGVDIEMIAYGDITTNTFVWRNIVNKDNKLVLE